MNEVTAADARGPHERVDGRPVAEYDLIVIGGGVNGTAIAREVALSGATVALIEREDFGCGTSAASTRLIHGGLRYLEHGDVGLVRESLRERRRLLRDAPHLVEPLQLYLPLYRGHGRPRWKIRAGMLLYDLLSIDGVLPRHRMLDANQMRERVPALQQDGLLGGAAYHDAQVRFPERMVLELALDAAAAGARLLTHTSVTRIETESGRVRGIVCEHQGRPLRLAATTVVNASGPWVDLVNRGIGARRLIGGTRGVHLIAKPFPGAPPAAVYAEARSDGRPFFVVPWNGLYLIGTTDERFSGDPADVGATVVETRYLAAETAALLSLATPFEPFVCYAQAGVRPLPHSAAGQTAAITRGHVVHRHREVDGLFSIVGGKLTTHRALAEDVVRKLKARLRIFGSSPTRERRFPGALTPIERTELIDALRARFGERCAERLWRIYGSAAERILADAREPELARPVADGSDVIVAELYHGIEREHALTLRDLLFRRTMAGLDADRALGIAGHSADRLVRIGLWDDDRAVEELRAYNAQAERLRPRFG